MKTRKAERLQSPSLSPAIRRNTQVFCRVVTSTFRGSVVASLTRHRCLFRFFMRARMRACQGTSVVSVEKVTAGSPNEAPRPYFLRVRQGLETPLVANHRS
jgi:hypothetical protein